MGINVPVSTEGRVWVAQLTRDINARQRAGANMLAPGTKTWSEAFQAFVHALADCHGPTKAAKKFHAGYRTMRDIQKQGGCFVNASFGRTRSGMFHLLTWEVEPHPLLQKGNEGIAVRDYYCKLQRNGCISLFVGANLAFISWHALARMRERSKIDMFDANGVVCGVGLAGLLLRDSAAHTNTEINYAIEDMVCLGVLRHAVMDGRGYNFYDVLTVLTPDYADMAVKIKQGVSLSKAVHEYASSTTAVPTGFAERIPVLPFRDSDYVSRMMASQQGRATLSDQVVG